MLSAGGRIDRRNDPGKSDPPEHAVFLYPEVEIRYVQAYREKSGPLINDENSYDIIWLMCTQGVPPVKMKKEKRNHVRTEKT